MQGMGAEEACPAQGCVTVCLGSVHTGSVHLANAYSMLWFHTKYFLLTTIWRPEGKALQGPGLFLTEVLASRRHETNVFVREGEAWYSRSVLQLRASQGWSLAESRCLGDGK